MNKLLLFLFLFAGIANAQVVNIPDANFKAKLIELGVDTNTDGNIQFSEAESVTSLDITNSNIANLTGIEAFTNLTTLRCGSNLLTSINVSNLILLETLECDENPITNIDISLLSNLNFLGVGATLITSLDFSNNPDFWTLRIADCTQLTSLNVSGHTTVFLDVTGTNSLQNLNFNGCTNIQTNLPLADFISSNPISSADFTGVLTLTSLTTGASTLNISGCTNLTFLNIYNSSLNDFTEFINLNTLDVSNSNITSLNINGLTNLINLYCSENQLTNLDLSTNMNLKVLHCEINLLTSLDISGLTQLQSLVCINNNLSELNVNNNFNLTEFACSNNQITSLNVLNLNNLQTLYCKNNPITNLNLTTLTNLNGVECGGISLVNLFLKNGKNEGVSFTDSPNLAFICADDSQISTIQNQLNTLGMTNTVISSYCSFTPGGNYNTITGNIKYDENNNGCDAGDFVQPYAKIKIFDGQNNGSSFINNLGNYSFYTDVVGTYTITPEVQNPSYFIISPVNATINFPAVDNSTQTQNFCITANGVHPDLEIILTPIGVARPGFDANYKLIYKNKGNQTQSGSINLSFDDSKTDFIAASPTVANQGLNSLIWFYSDLQPFETREINFTLNINSPLETPPVNANDILSFTASINFVAGDETPSDNFFNLNQIVVNAIDPNNKICLEGNALLPERIGDYLHYNINFENIGTSEAVNVVVKDMIDLTKYDINSLQLLYASDSLETKIANDKVEFIFENINLAPSNGNPVGGHGNVLFKIRTLPTLPVGTEVINTANIYFDYNGPITTNEAKTTFSSLSNAIFIKDKSVTIFPNPTTSKINITSNFSIKSIEIYDVQGRILQSVIEDSKTSNLDISDKPNGVYFLKITTDKGSKIEKVVKE